MPSPRGSRACSSRPCGTPLRCSAPAGSASRSTTVTLSKWSASARAASRPAMLPPTTTARLVRGGSPGAPLRLETAAAVLAMIPPSRKRRPWPNRPLSLLPKPGHPTDEHAWSRRDTRGHPRDKQPVLGYATSGYAAPLPERAAVCRRPPRCVLAHPNSLRRRAAEPPAVPGPAWVAHVGGTGSRTSPVWPRNPGARSRSWFAAPPRHDKNRSSGLCPYGRRGRGRGRGRWSEDHG